MAVLAAARIERLQPQSTAEVLRTIPGIHAEEGGGEVAVNVFVRGLPSPGQYRYQTLQEDGMPVRSVPGGEFSAEDVFFRQDLNVQSLEVAKGGSSTLFGINAPGGIINYRSKTGGDVLSSTLRFTGGQRNLYRLDFNTNGPLGKDWRFDFGGFYRYDEGPRVSGLPTEGLQLKGNVTRLLPSGYLRIYLKYLNDRVQFLLPFAHSRQTIEPAIDPHGTHNSAEAADFTIPTPDGRFESTMANGVFTKGPALTVEYASDLGDGWSLENKTRWMDMEHEFNIFIPSVVEHRDSLARRFMADPATDGALYTFTNQPGQPFDGTFLVPQGAWARFRPTSDLANQMILKQRIATAAARHLLSLGAYLSRGEVTDKQIRPTLLFEMADRPRLVDLRIAHATGDTTRITRNGVLESSNNYFNRQGMSNTVAIFGGDETAIKDRLRIDLGARYERQTAAVRVENVSRFDLDTATLADQNVAFGNGTFVRRNVAFDDFGIALGASYAVSDAVNVYGTASRGFVFPTLGVFAGDVRLDSQGNFVQPEPKKNEQFLQGEAGLKFGGPQVSSTLAGFWVQIRDRLQTDIKIIDGQSLQVTDAVGKSRTIGVEATGAFAPRAIPGLQLEAALTVQDHEATDFVTPQGDFSGKEIKRIPKVALNASGFYDRSALSLTLNWSHLGRRFADDANVFELPAFDVLTADAGYAIPVGEDRSLRLGVNVYNLTDSKGVTEGDPRLPANVNPEQLPFVHYRPVLPRRFTFSATYTF